jgi:hypothetical protein
MGFCLMCFVAANDGMVAVLARRMKDMHFSVVIWWFSAGGVVLAITGILSKAAAQQRKPDLMDYSWS